MREEVLDTLTIDLKGWGSDDHIYTYSLGDDYFGAIGGNDILGGDIRVTLTAHKVSATSFSFHFVIKGTVEVECCRCLQPVVLTVDDDRIVPVVFGAEDGDDGETLTVEEARGEVSVAWLIYEFVALSVPVSPMHGEGGCDAGMMRILEEYTAAPHGVEGGDATDPRWSELQKIKDK